MEVIVAILIGAAVGFAALRSFGVSSAVDLGWLALASLFAGVWMVPALAAL